MLRDRRTLEDHNRLEAVMYDWGKCHFYRESRLIINWLVKVEWLLECPSLTHISFLWKTRMLRLLIRTTHDLNLSKNAMSVSRNQGQTSLSKENAMYVVQVKVTGKECNQQGTAISVQAKSCSTITGMDGPLKITTLHSPLDLGTAFCWMLGTNLNLRSPSGNWIRWNRLLEGSSWRKPCMGINPGDAAQAGTFMCGLADSSNKHTIGQSSAQKKTWGLVMIRQITDYCTRLHVPYPSSETYNASVSGMSPS